MIQIVNVSNVNETYVNELNVNVSNVNETYVNE